MVDLIYNLPLGQLSLLSLTRSKKRDFIIIFTLEFILQEKKANVLGVGKGEITLIFHGKFQSYLSSSLTQLYMII